MTGMHDHLPQTIPAFLADAVARRGDEPALGAIRDGELSWRTWREVAADARGLAAVLRSAGIQPGDRIAQLSENRYEWIIADLAIQLVGAVHVPIHVTLSAQQIAEHITHSAAPLLFVSSEKLQVNLAGLLPATLKVFVHDHREACLAPTASVQHPAADQAAEGACPDDLATILYTSGTTGPPRGVMLSQRNLAANAAAIADAHGGGADQTRLCVLPLSHIYARTCDLYTWIYRGSRLVLAESRETLARDCRLSQPTALSAVPYLYQRIAERIRAAAPGNQEAAVRAVFGDKMERLSCGGAPLAPHIDAWYAQCDLPILPGYGLTEASPVVATSTLTCRRHGAVGRPLPNVDVQIAADGEILVRGPNVMLGYWRDAAATAEAIRDGWLRTGDLGELDADGFLYVRGRKKELIVLSTGKKVFPTRVESLLAASPLIEQAAIFGDDRPGLVALIVPSAGGLAAGMNAQSTREQIAAEVKRCLLAAAHEEQIRQFALVDRPFTIERGELTPKLSLCRAVIARNFSHELENLGATSAGEISESMNNPQRT
jgi:long-chain acyl-CoA synthetase